MGKSKNDRKNREFNNETYQKKTCKTTTIRQKK